MHRAVVGTSLRTTAASARDKDKDGCNYELICGVNRPAVWAALRDIGNSTLRPCCYITLTNGTDCPLFLHSSGGDDRYCSFLFDMNHVFPHQSPDLEGLNVLFPGFTSGAAQRMLSTSTLRIYDGYISFCICINNRKYTVSCCWHEWLHNTDLIGTKAGIVIRTGDASEITSPELRPSSLNGYPCGQIATVVDCCTSTYFGNGLEFKNSKRGCQDFSVICTYRRSAFHFEILSVPPESAEKCSGFLESNLLERVGGNLVTEQMEIIAKHLPDITFSCVYILNNTPVQIDLCKKSSTIGYFFTPATSIASVPINYQLGFLQSQEINGMHMCSGWVSYKFTLLRDEYVCCFGWKVDTYARDYSAGMEIRILPKLLDRNCVNVNQNGVSEVGKVENANLFVTSIRTPYKCYADLVAPSSRRGNEKPRREDGLKVPTIVSVGRVEGMLMFTKEQFQFSLSCTH